MKMVICIHFSQLIGKFLLVLGEVKERRGAMNNQLVVMQSCFDALKTNSIGSSNKNLYLEI